MKGAYANIMNIPVPQNFNDSEMLFVIDKLDFTLCKKNKSRFSHCSSRNRLS